MYLCVVIQPFFFQIGSEETSISGSQVSEPGVSESDFAKGGLFDIQSESIVTVATAQRYVSLFFALCPKVQRFAFLNIPLPQAEEHEKQHSASFFIIFFIFLFFAHSCFTVVWLQKSSLLQLLFDNYARAPKAVKQVSFCSWIVLIMHMNTII